LGNDKIDVTVSSDPREIPYIKDVVTKWAKHMAYGMLFKEGYESFCQQNYDAVDELLNKAQKITDITSTGIWFFNSIDVLFHKETVEHFRTGFKELDANINPDAGGVGPSRKEILCFMAGTGVGKSLIMINVGVQCVREGQKVLHVSLENSKEKTMQRYAGCITNVPIRDRIKKREKVAAVIDKFNRSTKGDLVIYEYAADEISVNEIYQLISHLERTKGWHPDIIIVDYLELLLSRRSSVNNESEYIRQKRVSTELRSLAQNENALVITATQTNREGYTGGDQKGPQLIGLGKAAESYGKLMPMDCVVSINQTPEQKTERRATLYIAKNRNGLQGVKIEISINYDTTKAIQETNMGVAI